VLKVFIVLTPQFLSRDKDQLTKELQQHVKSVTVSCKSPRKVILFHIVNFLPGHFHPGPDFFGIPWMLIIIVGSLGIYKLAIFFCKTSLGVSTLTFPRGGLNMDLQGKACRSNSHRQEGIKMDLKYSFTSWRSTEAKVQAKVQKVMMKVNSHCEISGQRKTAEEEKLRMKEREREEKERRLSEVEETMKLALEKIPICKWVQKPTPASWESADRPFCCKKGPQPLGKFVHFSLAFRPSRDMDVFFSPQLCAQALQREMAERKAACKQHSPISVVNCVEQKRPHPHPVVRGSIF
uniref:Nuclear pore complex interacting protein N-terminal domain-containing protein n=1 Tax=Pan paniscus TaxID=9597 RepID=A0A2R9CAW0_PANPA